MPRPELAHKTKRGLDVLLATAVLVLLSPVLLAIAAAIRWCMGSPVLFRQTRIGFRERAFRVWKFRSMSNTTGANGLPLADGERLTPLGRFLRASSLDEIPQLWNVLRGEMSIVGPRPLLPEYLPRYSLRQRRRHEAKPGITGWAQVNGRNATTWERRFELDVWYVDHWSLSLDLRILAMTLERVLRPRGIHLAGHATMPEFPGTPDEVRQV